jgi:hypothetical protein
MLGAGMTLDLVIAGVTYIYTVKLILDIDCIDICNSSYHNIQGHASHKHVTPVITRSDCIDICNCHHGRDRMVVGFTTTYAISAYHHWCCEFESRSGQGVQHYVIKVCQWLAKGLWNVCASGKKGATARVLRSIKKWTPSY